VQTQAKETLNKGGDALMEQSTSLNHPFSSIFILPAPVCELLLKTDSIDSAATTDPNGRLGAQTAEFARAAHHWG
jgi:hypothetical protein